jgi:hypothetical protein
LDEVYGATDIYSTYFALGQCTYASSVYTCPTNLVSGTLTLYTGLYDASGYLLSTNYFANPSSVTIYPNGSAYSNNLYVTTQGVVSQLTTYDASNNCFAAGHQQSIPVYLQDYDGNLIVGPLANPITPNFTPYNGAGRGAVDIYAMYNGSPISMDGITIYDSSVYSSPYFYVSGAEGAVTVAATVQNLPVLQYGTYLTYSASGGYGATGTYTAWGIPSDPTQGIYEVAIQQSLNQAVLCGNGGTSSENLSTPMFVGSIRSAGGAPYLVVADESNNVGIFDAYVVADYTRTTYDIYGTNLLQTGLFTAPGPFVNFFTSAEVTGRIDVLSNPTNGQVDLIDTTNGAITADHAYAAQLFFNAFTRLSGYPGASVLYYNQPTTPYLYGINTSSNTPYATIDMSIYPYDFTAIWALAPSGPSHSYQFIRGGAGSQKICVFDSLNYAMGLYCTGAPSADSNPASMSFDSGTGSLMWATNTSTVYAFNAYQTPANFVSTFNATPSIYTLAHSAFRVEPGLEGTPGVVGFYGGPIGTGPCAGTGEITWLQYNGSSWVYLASLCWPNMYVTLTYP